MEEEEEEEQEGSQLLLFSSLFCFFGLEVELSSVLQRVRVNSYRPF